MNINRLFIKNLYKPTNSLYSKYFLNNYVVEQIDKLKEREDTISKANNIVKKIREKLPEDIINLTSELNEALVSLRKAIVGERNFAGYIYTTNIPLNKNYITENTTTKIVNNVVLGISEKEKISENTSLNISNIVSNTSNLNLTQYDPNPSRRLKNISVDVLSSFLLLDLDVSAHTGKGVSLILNFKEHQIIEVLEGNKLIITKQLKKSLIIPINTQSLFTIKLFKTSEVSQKIYIESIGVTNKIITEETVYESLPIDINKELEYISFDICDNNEDKSEVSLDYYLKINEQQYEKISNSNNIKISENLQNVIKGNKQSLLKMKELTRPKKANENDFRFYLDETSLDRYSKDVYLKNNLNISNTSLFIVVKEDMLVSKQACLLNTFDSLYINNKLVEKEEILLLKGITEIVCIDSSSQISNLNLNYLNTVADTCYISKLKKEIQEDDLGFYIKLNNLDLKKSYNLLETNEKYSCFIESLDNRLFVKTLQIKCRMKSLNKTTIPYISRIIIKGL